MRWFRASDDAQIAFSESGSGAPAIVFIHGWQADHTVWSAVIELLDTNVHTLAVDLRGSGESHGAPGPYRLERFAADIREMVDELGVGPVVVIGHSMGATVALRFALDAPRSTRALVLIAPVPASGGGFSPKGEAYLRATVGDPVAARAWLTRTFAAAPDERFLGPLCAAAARNNPSAMLESFESWAHADFAQETREIRGPVLVVAPEHDVPDVHERKVAALLPNARCAMLSDCGHYAIVEKPKEIADLIRGFVTMNDAVR